MTAAFAPKRARIGISSWLFGTAAKSVSENSPQTWRCIPSAAFGHLGGLKEEAL